MARLARARLLIVGLLALAVAACESTPPPPAFPMLTWTHLQPIRLDVSGVRVVDNYQPPMVSPNVEHLFPVIPARAMREWANDRLRAVGSTGEATFVIKEAKAVEVSLPTRSGVTSLFTDQQSQRYDLTMIAELEIRDPGGRGGYVQAQSRISRSVAQSISLNDRERVWFEMVEAAMNDLNAAMENEINSHLGNFVR